jgi:hypothetical protein
VQQPPNRLIGCLPFREATGLSGGILDMSGDPPDHCRADVENLDPTVQHCENDFRNELLLVIYRARGKYDTTIPQWLQQSHI